MQRPCGQLAPGLLEEQEGGWCNCSRAWEESGRRRGPGGEVGREKRSGHSKDPPLEVSGSWGCPSASLSSLVSQKDGQCQPLWGAQLLPAGQALSPALWPPIYSQRSTVQRCHKARGMRCPSLGPPAASLLAAMWTGPSTCKSDAQPCELELEVRPAIA